MNDYEAKRLENIKRNKALIQELGIPRVKSTSSSAGSKQASRQKRKFVSADISAPRPSRSSARIASASSRPSYTDDNDAHVSTTNGTTANSTKRRKKSLSPTAVTTSNLPRRKTPPPPPDTDSVRANWASWEATAPPPTRDDVTGTYHFASHPDFQPNKSPEEVLREGAFGGSHFRPIYSKTLGTTIADDYLTTLAPDWLASLPASTYLTNPTYQADVNKFGVSCGQSIEEWEAAGWINHTHDPRGWFQWYCRFFRGRRLDDGEDERQVGRWRRCVGETGRWRRLLLKKYSEKGVRTVWEDEGDEAVEVSPVMHQTCHHWGWEVRQGALDEFWTGLGR